MSDQPSIDALSDFDMFFYYGSNDLDMETRHDLMLNLIQPKRSLLGNRASDAAGVPDYENTPVGISQQIKLPFDIVQSISRRNQYVSNGENGTKDRRVAVSQSAVRVETSTAGNVNITVQYIPLANFKESEISVPLGIGI